MATSSRLQFKQCFFVVPLWFLKLISFLSAVSGRRAASLGTPLVYLNSRDLCRDKMAVDGAREHMTSPPSLSIDQEPWISGALQSAEHASLLSITWTSLRINKRTLILLRHTHSFTESEEQNGSPSRPGCYTLANSPPLAWFASAGATVCNLKACFFPLARLFKHCLGFFLLHRPVL